MKNLIFSPQPNATPDEIMQVLKVIIIPLSPYTTEDVLMEAYEALPPEAKRHFKIEESK
jgi:hypothetical protein